MGIIEPKKIERGRFYDIKLAFIMNSFQFRNIGLINKQIPYFDIVNKTNVILKYYNTNNNANK